MGRQAVVDRLIEIESAEKNRLDSARHPLGTNNVKYNTAYYGHPVSDPKGKLYAWCVVFQWWCFQKAGIPTSIFPKTASVFAVRDWFQKKSRYFHSPMVGDLIIFKYSHIGLVETITSDGKVVTLEGNKSNRVKRVIHRRSDTDIDGYCRPEYHKVEEDDFMALFDNVNEFKAAVRAVVQDEVRPIVKDEVGKVFKALARGEINGQIDPNSTHFKDSHRGLHEEIRDEVSKAYEALARGEINNQIDENSTHFKDSHRGLAKQLQMLIDRLAETTPNP
jgi:hypothetical protein